MINLLSFLEKNFIWKNINLKIFPTQKIHIQSFSVFTDIMIRTKVKARTRVKEDDKMSRITWMDSTLKDGANGMGLEQVLQLAEEMFDSLADRLQHKVEEQCSEK
jgi:hypothetical protein